MINLKLTISLQTKAEFGSNQGPRCTPEEDRKVHGNFAGTCHLYEKEIAEDLNLNRRRGEWFCGTPYSVLGQDCGTPWVKRGLVDGDRVPSVPFSEHPPGLLHFHMHVGSRRTNGNRSSSTTAALKKRGCSKRDWGPQGVRVDQWSSSVRPDILAQIARSCPGAHRVKSIGAILNFCPDVGKLILSFSITS